MSKSVAGLPQVGESISGVRLSSTCPNE